MTAAEELRGVLRLRLVQLLAFTALMAGLGATLFAIKYSVLDPDIWMHLKVGDWIVQHHAVPHTGLFSNSAAGRPWTAYSWGYEISLSRAYAWFGLLGVGAFGVLLALTVTGILFWMFHRLSGRFWTAWILTLFVGWPVLFNVAPRPVFFSMLLFSVTLTLILEAQRSGRTRLLYWLPLVFLVWANVHIQFIYGLFTVGLFVGFNLLARAAASLRIEPDWLLSAKLPLPPLLAVFATCVLASGIGPYSFHLYQVVFEYATAHVLYSINTEMQPLSFRGLNHYVELLLATAGFFAVGRQKKLDPFKIALLAVASLVAFRTTRDGWFICISSGAFIADSPPEEHIPVQRRRLLEYVGVVIALMLLLVLAARDTDFTPRGLDAAVSTRYPVDAVNFLRRNAFPGPLYNDLDWGGFLIWYLPQYPVAIDGRNDLYGEDLNRLFYSSEFADPKSYTQDPYLKAAGVVLLQSRLPLAKVLAMDGHFRLVYRDAISVIFVRE